VFFVSMTDELITSCAPDAPPVDATDDGEVTSPRAAATVTHAQRVAEGTQLQIHRDTWRYNVLIEDQRRVVLDYRDEMLRTGAALRALERSCPERVAELRDTVPDGVLAGAARQITLGHLDRAWSEYLARAGDLREGIHLRSLGHGPNPFGAALNPVEEFNRELTGMFGDFTGEVTAATEETFRTAPITADGVDLAAAGLKRPSATWTYVVQDNPFGTDFSRAAQAISRLLGRR
jgi:preprotein translocase subunit SecA